MFILNSIQSLTFHKTLQSSSGTIFDESEHGFKNIIVAGKKKVLLILILLINVEDESKLRNILEKKQATCTYIYFPYFLSVYHFSKYLITFFEFFITSFN